MRIAYINKSDTATIAASSEAAGLVASNLKTNYKTEIWRSTGTSATLTVVWPAGKQVSVVSLPFCSLSSSATVRIRMYTLASDASPSYDSGVVVALPPIPLTEWPWGSTTLGVNSYAFGSKATMVKWVPVGAYEKIVIDLNDSLNPLGYIEAGRLFISSYYEFEINADLGAQAGTTDNSTQYRNDASDLLTDRSFQFKTLSFSLSSLKPLDRVQLSNILKVSALSGPVLVSLLPEYSDVQLEQDYQIYGKLTSLSAISITQIDRFSGSVELQEA